MGSHYGKQISLRKISMLENPIIHNEINISMI